LSQIDVYIDPDASGTGTGVDWTNAYNSLNAAEAAEQKDFVTDTDNIVFHVKSSAGTADTTAVSFDGSTTSAIYNIEVINEDDHKGKWNAAAYRLQAANQNVLQLYDAFITLTGLQVELTSINANYQKVIHIDNLPSGSVTNLDKVIIKSANNGTYRERVFGCDSARTVNVYNSVIWNGNRTNASAANSLIHNAGATLNLYNVTLSTGYNGLYGSAGTTKAINCIFHNLIAVVDTGTWTSSDYNASDLGTTTGGAHDITSATFGFTDSSNGDLHLTSGDASGCKNGGTDNPASGLYSDDIDGKARVSIWDIGCDEYIVSSGNPWYTYAQQQ